MLIVICDDVTADREILHEYISCYAKEKQLPITILEFENSVSLLQSSEVKIADAIFLDIYMDGPLGIEAAHILRQNGYSGSFVLTTTSQDHYADGFDIEALHYLLKPISYSSFYKSMRRIHERLKLNKRKIKVTSNRNTLDIDVSGILYIEVYGHKTIIHTAKGNLEVNQSLATLEECLGGEPFLRCYRSYIINMDYVKRLNNDSFTMKDGKNIPLSRDRRTTLRNRYMSYIFKKMET